MSKKVSIRLISEYGRNAMQLTMDSKLREIREKAADVLKCKNSEITLTIDGKKIVESDNMSLCKVKNIKSPVTVINASGKSSGSEMMIEEKKAPNNHSSTLASTSKDGKMDEESLPIRPKCTHGPMGKCIGCLNDSTKQAFNKPKNEENQDAIIRPELTNDPIKKAMQKPVCSHPPHGMCSDCMDKDDMDAKHKPFDKFLSTIRQNCTHMPDTKCPNCSINFDISYKKVENCKRHGSNALCTQCLPQA